MSVNLVKVGWGTTFKLLVQRLSVKKHFLIQTSPSQIKPTLTFNCKDILKYAKECQETLFVQNLILKTKSLTKLEMFFTVF